MPQPSAPLPPLDAPLAGYRLLDLSQGVAGPYCAHLLSRQGADVIKIVPPEGDWSRHVGLSRDGQSTLSSTYNAGKRSLIVDLASLPVRRCCSAWPAQPTS